MNADFDKLSAVLRSASEMWGHSAHNNKYIGPYSS